MSKLLETLHRMDKKPNRRHERAARGRRPALEVLEGRSLLSTIIVNSTADTNPAVRSAAGVLTLREAILLADLSPALPYASLTAAEKKQLSGPPSATAPNTIIFEIGNDLESIFIGSKGLGPLPAITRPTIIDGTAPRSANGAVIPQYAAQLIELRGSSKLPAKSDGLQVIGGSSQAGGGSVIQGLIIDGFATGIDILGNTAALSLGSNTVQGCYVGVNSAGEPSARVTPNTTGIAIQNSPNNTIGSANVQPPAVAANRGNVVSNNTETGIAISGPNSSGNTVIGNFVGTDRTGTKAAGNKNGGVFLFNGAYLNTVQYNTISANGFVGVLISNGANNTIANNFIGTDRTGTKPLGNKSAGVELIDLAAVPNPIANNQIENNLISANTGDGVVFFGSSGNTVTGNLIGTDPTGTIPLGNTGNGIRVANATGEFIAKNLIAASGALGVELSSSSNNAVQGNFIGTDKTGTLIVAGNGKSFGNGTGGVFINTGNNNTIGGIMAGQGNLIAGNDGNGVTIAGDDANNPVTGNLVQGNFIGTNKTGTTALSNQGYGVQIYGIATNNLVGDVKPFLGVSYQLSGGSNLIAGNTLSGVAIVGAQAGSNAVSDNFIGTTSSGTAKLGNGQAGQADGDGILINNAPTSSINYNVISGNKQNGVSITGATATVTTLYGNLIGTDPTGMVKVGNTLAGVAINGVAGNFIGTQGRAVNVISANGGAGVSLAGAGAIMNQVVNNYIGTGLDGSTPLGNSGAGVSFAVGSTGNTVLKDVIAANAGAGIRDLNPAPSNTFSQNSIFDNAQLGIDIAAQGPTLDGVPALSSAVVAPNQTTVTGTLASQPNTTYTLEFFANPMRDPSGYGQGKTYLGAMTVTTDGAGNAKFTAQFVPTEVPPGQFISATSTGPKGTTEFSKDVTVTAQQIQRPMANNDQYNTAENQPLIVNAANGVLANDTDPNGLPLSAVLVTQSADGQVTLNSDGSFTYNPGTNSFGPDSFTYEDTDGLAISNVATVDITVTPVSASTTTTVNSTPAPSVYGQPVTFTAGVAPVSPGGAMPIGTVTFVASSPGATNVTLGTAPLGSTGTAVFTTDQLVPATYTISAVYQGDANNAGSTSATITQVVDQADTTITLSSSNSTVVLGQPNTLTESLAVVSPGTAVVPLTGTITVYDTFQGTTTQLGVFTLGQSASFPALTAVGTHVLTAVYSGDSNYNGSTSAAITVVVEPDSTTSTVDSSSPTSLSGQPVSFTATVATVAPGVGTPTGTVQFQVDGTDLGMPVPLSAGVATSPSITTLPAGQDTITALYSGDADQSASTGSFTQTVDVTATTTTVMSDTPTSVVGQLVTLTASVVPVSPGGAAPTGTVAFVASSPGATNVTLGTAPLGSTGTAVFTTDQLVPATYTISAVYQGDANNAGSTSATITQVVDKADTTITLSSSNSTVVLGQPNTLSESLAVVPPGAVVVALTGTITLYDTFQGSTTELGVFTLGQSGSFPALTAVGTHVLTAVYSGDSNYNGSTSATITLVVDKADTALTLTQITSPQTVDEITPDTASSQSPEYSLTLTAVAPGAFVVPPTGTITIYDTYDGTTTMLATLTVGQSGQSPVPTGVGTDVLTAVYSGDSNDNGCTSNSLTEIIGSSSTS